MNIKLTLKQNNSILLIQKKYKLLKHQIDNINIQLTIYQDLLMSMLNNLVYCNKINIYSGTNTSFMNILKELKEINDLLITIPNKILISTLKTYSLTNINLVLYQVNKLLLKYSNHISFENFNYILELFYDKNWTNFYNNKELEILLFLNKFFKPISVWDSQEHIKPIPYPNIFEPKIKNETITKNFIESLLGSNNTINNNDNTINNNGNTINNTSIIIGDNSMPSFIKSINDLIQYSSKKVRDINNIFSANECNNILDSCNIKITKNLKSSSLFEDKYGACVYLRINNKFLVIQGIFKDDVLDISRNIEFIHTKYKEHMSTLSSNLFDVPQNFKNNYLKILNLRDIVVCIPNELCDELKKKFNDFKSIQSTPLMSLINEFLLASKYRKVDILTLLLMSNEEDMKLAYILYDILKSKDKKNIAREIYESLHYSIRELLDSSQKIVEDNETNLDKLTSSDIPYEKRIIMMNTDEEVKVKAIEKLKTIKNNFQGDNKAQAWLDGLLKIPFGKFSKNHMLDFKEIFLKKLILQYPNEKLYSDIEITNFFKINKNINDKLYNEWNTYIDERKIYLKSIRSKLDNAVYGHTEAKTQLERIFAQWINGESKGAILGLHGPPGTGKTSLAKNGLSKCLIDENGKSRPFAFLPIGGSVNGSTLVGHNFTYVGSTWGRIVDILITSKCMNPIIFIDEIDKVSTTEHGREIISILTHLTDSTQNDEFEDKYFAGIKIDLSKALIVFSFNDISVIDPILKDRITIIETNSLTLFEKIHIIKNYMLPEITKEVGLTMDEISISEEIIKYLIETYTNESGVRRIKEKIQEIIRDINLNRIYYLDPNKIYDLDPNKIYDLDPNKIYDLDPNKIYDLDPNKIYDVNMIPFKVTKEYINLLFENKPKIRIKTIAKEPSIGLVNGLYATNTGIGGITIIQVIKFPSNKMLELNITGKQGEVMKESVDYAMKIAFTLLTNEEQEKLIEDSKNKKTFGLHIHTPDAATPKDGPSAGAAITLAIYSVLSGKKINNKVAMTGEIDLCKKITAIGGVDAKLNGAKLSGVTTVLIPKENKEDLEKMRRSGLSPEDDNFKIIFVEHIDEVLKYAVIK